MPRFFSSLIFACGAGLVACSQEKLPEHTLVLQDHRFTPSEITIPAGSKVRIVIDNRDDSSEEFDSDSLGREKVVPGKSSGAVVIGPLKPGRYPFMGEFHAQTAQGAVIVQ
jgi:plastocyanin